MRNRLQPHRRSQPKRRGQAALALPLAMIVTFLVTLCGLALLELSRLESVRAVHDMRDLQALAAAEFGVDRARAMTLSQNRSWTAMTCGGSQLVFHTSSDPLYAGHRVSQLFAEESVGGAVTAHYSVVIEELDPEIQGDHWFRVHSFGAAGERTHHITLDYIPVTFGSYAWFTNDENGKYFYSGDKVDGLMHSNDQLNFWGSPVFTGKVTSSASSVSYANGGPPADNPVFEKGLHLNAPEVSLDSAVVDGHFATLRNAAQQADGLWLGPNDGRPYRLRFNQNGNVQISRQKEGDAWELIKTVNLSDLNGAIYVEEHVYLDGVVNGQVTLGTSEGKDIMIADSVTYAYPMDVKDVFEDGFDYNDPLFNDKLGLLSGRDVLINKAWNNNWGDLYLMASIIAVRGSFTNTEYERSNQKTLHVYGGVAQDLRGDIGTKAGTGFLRDYKYDPRLIFDPPPYYAPIGYMSSTWNLKS